MIRQLESRGYELFYPKYLPGSGKPGKQQLRAYFPGYIFIRLDLRKHSISTFQWMPNTDGLVCFGLKPAYVPDNLIEAIQQRTGTPSQSPFQDGDCTPQPAGTTPGLQVIFDLCLSSDERVKELLQLMQGMNLAPLVSD